MSSIAALKTGETALVWGQAEEYVRAAHSLEAAAGAFLDALYGRFNAALPLARVFVTQSLGQLPHWQSDFVRSLASESGAVDELNEATNVLTLVASRGKEPAWNDIRQSQGHAGIPLVSNQFVEAIPMVSRMLHDLGLAPDLHLVTNAAFELGGGGWSIRTFYVADAQSTTDDRGRFIIPNRDFVDTYGIRTVFGGGGLYTKSAPHALACIFFTNEIIPVTTAQLFEPLFKQFKEATLRFVQSGRIFDTS